MAQLVARYLGIGDLLSRRPGSQAMQDLREHIRSLNSTSEERLAWLLGLGSKWSEMLEGWESLRQQIADLPVEMFEALLSPREAAVPVLRPLPAALMFGSAAPDLSLEDRVLLVTRLADAFLGHGERVQPVARGEEQVDTDRPWEQGYELAQEMLTELGIEDDSAEPVCIDGILRERGVEVQDIALADPGTRAVAIGGPHYRPTVLVNTTHRTNHYSRGRRFTLAHELCHLLFDAAHAQDLAVASGPWAPLDVEQRANAFAAMLLMPPGRLRSAMAAAPGRMGSEEFLTSVAGCLQVSYTAATRHLHNMHVIGEHDEEDLLRGAYDRSGPGPSGP